MSESHRPILQRLQEERKQKPIKPLAQVIVDLVEISKDPDIHLQAKMDLMSSVLDLQQILASLKE